MKVSPLMAICILTTKVLPYTVYNCASNLNETLQKQSFKVLNMWVGDSEDRGFLICNIVKRNFRALKVPSCTTCLSYMHMPHHAL